MTTKQICFLDIEDTIMEPVLLKGWYMADVLVKNCNKIKSWIDANSVSELHIFSFALWGPGDAKGWEDYKKSYFEKFFGMSFTSISMRDDILKACCIEKGLSANTVTWAEIVDFYGKETAFEFWVKQKTAGTTENVVATLIDDAVEDSSRVFTKRLLTINTINIDNM